MSSVDKLRRKIKTTSLLIRKQFFIDLLHRKKKVKAILDNKGMRAQRLFWELINSHISLVPDSFHYFIF